MTTSYTSAPPFRNPPSPEHPAPSSSPFNWDFEKCIHHQTIPLQSTPNTTITTFRPPKMNQIPRIGRQIAADLSSLRSQFQSSSSSSQKRFFTPNKPRRANQHSSQHPHYHQPATPGSKTNPELDRINQLYRQRNRSTAYYTISVILGTVALSYGSVPMYKMICQTTGWGGQPVRAHGGSTTDQSPEDITAKLSPVTTSPRIRVSFSASVSDLLDWKFVPQQREVRVLPGETALAFYTATNNTDKDIIGVATYSVTPAQVAPYFSKIQCFCFEEQRLQAGETVDMPVFFYLDPDMLNDLNMRGIKSVVLNYTFFKARYDDQK